MNLSAEDRASLLAGIGKLAREREAGGNFDGFVGWLRRRGPLPFLVDGANVGMYNQNFSESRFNFQQVEKVMDRLRPRAAATAASRGAALGGSVDDDDDAAPAPAAEAEAEADVDAPPASEAGADADAAEETKAPETADAPVDPADAPVDPARVDADLAALLATRPGSAVPVNFLHVRRVKGGPANHHRSKQIVDRWKRAGELFTTPAGSNDDWYWLYAAVASGDDAFLVSNDEMRDHVFQMLPSPKLFARWKERHQARSYSHRFPYDRVRVVNFIP